MVSEVWIISQDSSNKIAFLSSSFWLFLGSDPGWGHRGCWPGDWWPHPGDHQEGVCGEQRADHRPQAQHHPRLRQDHGARQGGAQGVRHARQPAEGDDTDAEIIYIKFPFIYRRTTQSSTAWWRMLDYCQIKMKKNRKFRWCIKNKQTLIIVM